MNDLPCTKIFKKYIILPSSEKQQIFSEDLQQRKMKNCEVNNAAELISEASKIF